ncbi:MAG: alpha/beta hydrolase [Polyangiaceae bacterium]|nr:alpha/beta hydrolase [Polyangiaceae bacterium]
MTLVADFQRSSFQSLLKLPPSLKSALFGAPKCAPEGYAMDLDMHMLLSLSNVFHQADWPTLGPQKARAMMDDQGAVISRPVPTHISFHDEVLRLPGRVIRARVYRDKSLSGPLPIIVYYHGGGYVFGSLRSHHNECAHLADLTRSVVVAVDYRLSPEHAFPAAPDDGLASYLWVHERAASFGGDPARMAVAGDSAGGNLSTVICLDLKGDPRMPIFQCLIYPPTDFTRSTPSHEYFRDGFFLTRRSIDWFFDQYMPLGNLTHPRASPQFAESHKGLPPALIVTAGFDPLRDEAKVYADTLSAAGVTVTYKCFEGLFHGFFSMSMIPAAHDAFVYIADALRDALAA